MVSPLLPPIGEAKIFSCGAIEMTSAGADAIGGYVALRTPATTSATFVHFNGTSGPSGAHSCGIRL